MAALTTLANVKTWLGITSSDDDALLTSLIGSASAFIEEWCGCSFSVVSESIKRDGHGGHRAVLPNYPVVAVASVSVDGVAITAAASFTAAGYRVDDMSVILNCYRFNRGLANVQITYSHGYASVPADVAQACIEMVALRYRERDRIGYQSKTLAGETITFMVSDMSQPIRAVLSQYKRVVPA